MKLKDITFFLATTASFHILYNSAFIKYLIQCYIVEVTGGVIKYTKIKPNLIKIYAHCKEFIEVQVEEIIETWKST